ncbi:MAG: hypothetical protein FJ100_01835, partial [Deltaproteobacteria bacterium]|nr:hypothetical protein [Deltaproteobacteria bacterium]
MTTAPPAPLPIALADALPRPTRLREFDKVQERRYVQIELGRAVQLALLAMVLSAGAFAGGWMAGVQGWRPTWLARAGVAVATEAPPASAAAAAPEPAPHIVAVAAPAVASTEAMLAALDGAAQVAREAVAAPSAPLVIAAADERVVGSDEPAEPAVATSGEPALAPPPPQAEGVAAHVAATDPDGARPGAENTALPPAKPNVQPVHPDGEPAPIAGSAGHPNAAAVAAAPPRSAPEPAAPEPAAPEPAAPAPAPV